MYKLLILLISLISFSSVNAQELETSYTGYATYTYIEQKAWHENDGQVALNLNTQYGPFALRTQIATRDEPIRRLALEYAYRVPGDTFLVQVGRVPRISNLISDVYGNSDEWGVAVLPLSTYNRRKVHSTNFNAIDGIKLLWDHNYDYGNNRFSVDYGIASVDNKQELQMELTRKPYNPGWGMKPVNGDYSVTNETSFDDWTFLVSHSHLGWNTELFNPLDRTSLYTTKAIKDIGYNFTRLGIKYVQHDWVIQAEHGLSRLYYNHESTLASKARDSYIMGTWYATDELATYIGYSEGFKYGNTYTARDRFAGVAYRLGDWSALLEYHNGENSWQRYNSNVYAWDSWVLSGVYKF